MGQSESTSRSSEQTEQLSEAVGIIQNELIHQTSHLLPSALCNYEDFLRYIHDLNALSNKVASQNGKKLVFGIKKGTDRTLLWKATVKIAVVQVDIETAEVVSSRLLNLPQFLRVFSTIKDQLIAALPHSEDESRLQNFEEATSTMDATCLGTMKKELTYSMLLNEVDQIAAESTDKLVECCICLERNTDVMLPCVHAYCLPCIEQWNVAHKTCPICRETLQTTDDAWVISDIPDSEDINREICSSLMNLAKEPDGPQNSSLH